jgi:hypothetical protein
MATPTTSAVSTTASVQPTIGTALRGRIEAIGIYDLLRIGVSKTTSGRLLVFNDQFDAELYYEQGRLVAVTSDSGKGADSLIRVLEMSEGEFEFTTGAELPTAQHDSAVHDSMMTAIKAHYQERVRLRQESTGDQPPLVRTSGVHRVVTEQSVDVSPIVNIEQPGESATSTVPARPSNAASVSSARLLPGELGRAIADIAGRASAKVGTVSPQEAALVALASKQAQSLATILGMRDLQRFEIVASNHRALLCQVAKDGIHFSAISDGADLDHIWAGLE